MAEGLFVHGVEGLCKAFEGGGTAGSQPRIRQRLSEAEYEVPELEKISHLSAKRNGRNGLGGAGG